MTPTSYLELLSSFTQLLTSKRSEVLAAQQRYETGLEKLAFTAEQVSRLVLVFQAGSQASVLQSKAVNKSVCNPVCAFSQSLLLCYACLPTTCAACRRHAA